MSNQQQAQRGFPYLGNRDMLAHPAAWRFGVEIKGILFLHVQQPGEDLDVLREQHPGVYILPNEHSQSDYGDMGREDLAHQLERAGVRMNRYRYDRDGAAELLVPHPARHPDDEALVTVAEARSLGLPHVVYRRWTMKDNAAVGINLSDIQDHPRISNYHAFSFELVSPILTNTEDGFRELARIFDLLYTRELFFNDSGGVDVHVGLDQYMIPLQVVKRIAAVSFASDITLVRYHYDQQQDNHHRYMIRNSSNVAHGLTAQRAQASSLAQLDNTVDFANRSPPPFRIDHCVTHILNAGSYGTLHKLLRRGPRRRPGQLQRPDVRAPARGAGTRPTMTVEFAQYSANMDHPDDLVAWVKVCLRLCSFAAGIDDPGFVRTLTWCHNFEHHQQQRGTTWRDLFIGFAGLEDVLDYYGRDRAGQAPGPPAAARFGRAALRRLAQRAAPRDASASTAAAASSWI
ncbi:hypothetical protein PG994_012499 [Apiospora phragmitis]|uniref:Uncharacterized protein n=1 Tax=Apiospora phragmitis TaxID=2905665 RepID=A0ABR1TVV3_9PEZI